MKLKYEKQITLDQSLLVNVCVYCGSGIPYVMCPHKGGNTKNIWPYGYIFVLMRKTVYKSCYIMFFLKM